MNATLIQTLSLEEYAAEVWNEYKAPWARENQDFIGSRQEDRWTVDLWHREFEEGSPAVNPEQAARILTRAKKFFYDRAIEPLCAGYDDERGWLILDLPEKPTRHKTAYGSYWHRSVRFDPEELDFKIPERLDPARDQERFAWKQWRDGSRLKGWVKLNYVNQIQPDCWLAWGVWDERMNVLNLT